MRDFGLRVGVLILPEHRWSVAEQSWVHADQLGFTHAWTYDHLTWRGHRDLPWFGAIPTLTAAAVATQSIALGMLVASPNFRHPVPFAKDLVTLDDVSEGRVIAGIGAGADGWDTTMLGAPPRSRRERTDRFEEFVALTDLLLRVPDASYDGSYYSASEARMYPGCVQQPRLPLAIAASQRRGMTVAAHHGDYWVTTGSRTRPDRMDAIEGSLEIRRQIDALEAICESVGRDPATLRRLVVTGPTLESGLTSVDAFAEVAGRYASVGVTDLVVHWPRPAEPYQADLETFERIFAA